MFTLTLLYSIIILVLCVGAFFILFHILRYSLSEALGYFGALIFGGIFLFLVFVNFLSFQALDTENVVPELELGPLIPSTATPGMPSSRNPW